MENEKNELKRDRLWLTGDSDGEPVAKRQGKDGSVEYEVVPCAMNQSDVALDSIEEKPCAKRLPIEGLDVIKVKPCAELNMKECSDGMELESCGRRQIAEALSDNMTGTSDKELVQPSFKVTEQQACEIKQAPESVNCMGVNHSVEQPVKEDLNDMELDPAVKKHSSGVSNDTEMETVIELPVKECLNEMELETHDDMQRTGVESDANQDLCGRMQTTGAKSDTEPKSSIKKPVKECSCEMETHACVEPLNESEPEPSVPQHVKECRHGMILEVCGRKLTTQSSNDTEIESSVIKQASQALDNTKLERSADRAVKECQNEIVVDRCSEKEASNDEISSEVSNPNVSPGDNSLSFQTANSQPDGKLVMKGQAVCGEIMSACSGNSGSDGSSSQKEHGTNDTFVTVSTSHVVIEVPKHASTSSGIRKITFKFSKRKLDYENQLFASAVKCMGGAFDNGTRKVPRLTHLNEQGLHEPGDSFLCPNDMEMMHREATHDSYPASVKRLLSTRILEGAKVKYISTSGELIGIVKDCGYLCSCANCKFSNVLRAHEFEGHAGGKTSHPNNHIYLENGKPIYSIIKAMKTAPLSTVDEAIRKVAGSSVNEELLQVWKGSLQRKTDRAKIDDIHHMKLMNLYHSTRSCTSHTREDGSSPYYCYHKSFTLEPQAFVSEIMKERKGLLTSQGHTHLALLLKLNEVLKVAKREGIMIYTVYFLCQMGFQMGRNWLIMAKGRKYLMVTSKGMVYFVAIVTPRSVLHSLKLMLDGL